MSAEADLQLILDAAARTPCVGPQDPANVAAWVSGAARRMVELQAKVDHLTACYTSAEREIAGFDDTIKDMMADAQCAVKVGTQAAQAYAQQVVITVQKELNDLKAGNQRLVAETGVLKTLLAQRDKEAQETLTDAVKVEQERNAIRRLVRSLFEDYLDQVEESDSGREFRPISIGCCRAAEVEPLTQLLKDLRVAVGLPAEAPKLERHS